MRKILIVEDEPILRETYEMIISSQPYICDVAKNGVEALKLCENREYDLILLDVMMPIMTGIDFLEKFDKLPQMASRIIILSNLSTGKELERARELGVTQNIVKADLSPKELVATIRYQLEAVK